MKSAAGPVDQPLEQLLYAQVLEWGTRVGLAVMVVGFGAYVLGLLPPLVPPARLAELWSQPVGSYLQQTHAPTGWGWLAQLRRGDVGGIAGVAVLAGCSLPGLLTLVPGYLRRGDWSYAALCLAQAGVLALAASGVLSVGR